MIALFATLRRRLQNEVVFVLLLLGVVVVAYGLNLRNMGFYWDDWETVHLASKNTFSAYWDYFSSTVP